MTGPSSLFMTSRRIRNLAEKKQRRTIGEARMKAPRSGSEFLAQRMAVKPSAFSASR